MLIRWTRQASQQLAAAHAYLAEDSPAIADRQVAIILHAIDRLVVFPEMGRPGRVDGTRELIVNETPFIVAYRLRNASIRILAVFHSARRWPRQFEN